MDMLKWKKIKPWQQYFAVCHGAGKFVAVSGYGQVFYSPTRRERPPGYEN